MEGFQLGSASSVSIVVDETEFPSFKEHCAKMPFEGDTR
jgi:hypothetical protein